MKICSVCKKELELTAFQRRRKSDPLALRNDCRTCRNTKGIADREQLRLEVLAAYGNKCVCCDITEKVFLALDHVNNDGHEHRRKLNNRSSHATFRWVKKNAFPKTFQILCFNCNEAKKYGVCPHQLAKVA